MVSAKTQASFPHQKYIFFWLLFYSEEVFSLLGLEVEQRKEICSLWCNNLQISTPETSQGTYFNSVVPCL